MPPPPPLPRLPAPTGLPVEAVVGALVEALGRDGAAVLVAEPGAGKTTVAPLRLLGAPWLAGRRIVLLEPRRVAARAAAVRMAGLLGEPVGATVGLRTRDETRVGPATRLEVVTEGVLTRMLQRDPGLDGVGLVVFDEFHERSLHADLGLALVLEVRGALREDLRVLVASATLDAGRVAALLGGAGDPAPVLHVAGRTHPVALRWSAAAVAPADPPGVLDAAAARATLDALDAQAGDVLVFLPGAAAIHRLARRLSGPLARADAPVDVLPLFGALPAVDQDRALAPSPPGRRRVVLATDLAETSLTVEGVGAVVDGGLARVPRHDPRSGMTRLVTVRISQASADQRAGRAGRTGPGLAIRLWTPADHATRRPHADPAVTQVDLTGLALELALWGADPRDAGFLDPPPEAALDHARRVLVRLGAVGEDGRPTARGRALAELPLHPRLARMVLAGRDSGNGWTACLLAALLDERDVLGGRPDEVPTDLALRLALVEGGRTGGAAGPRPDPAALARVRSRARDLARRARLRRGPVVPEAAGVLVATAYPDRVARARRDGPPGRFRLASGGGAWMAPHDELAGEELVVAADLDGDRREARIRLAAALDEAALVAASPVPPAERRRLVWDRGRDDLAVEVVRHLDGVELAVRHERPAPGPATTEALLDHVARHGLGVLGWTAAGRAARDRLAFLHRHRPEEWPDVGDDALAASLAEWLGPMLPAATGRADLAAVDPGALLVARLDHARRRDLDRSAPRTVALPSGRDARLDYSSGAPVLAVAPQELFGSTEHPCVLDGAVPVVLELVSPAGRPVQVTSDLAGFWAGSWAEVRKEMAGRYPKHPWPVDPATAEPPRRHRRPR